jgi:hypothetical protein
MVQDWQDSQKPMKDAFFLEGVPYLVKLQQPRLISTTDFGLE